MARAGSPTGLETPRHDDGFTAPGPLEMLQCFANTLDVEDARDELAKDDDLRDASGLRGWLLDHDLISSRDQVTMEDLRTAIELRTAFRSLAHANHGEPTSADALRSLDRVAAAADLRVRFRPGDTPVLEPHAKGPAGALGRLVAIAFSSMSEGSWRRLKICRADTCAVVFYDYSRNQSRAWCSMKICGNRTKVRNFRRRERAGRASS